jgi:hypothetical protein
MVAIEPSRAASPVPHLCAELQCFAAFAQMAATDVEALVLLARQTWYAPGEALRQSADGPVSRLLYQRRGSVAGAAQGDDVAGSRFVLESGGLFPAAA